MFDPLFLSKFPDLTSEEFARVIHLAMETEKKKKSGELGITSRDEWPDICEERIQRDIIALKHLLQRQ